MALCYKYDTDLSQRKIAPDSGIREVKPQQPLICRLPFSSTPLAICLFRQHPLSALQPCVVFQPCTYEVKT